MTLVVLSGQISGDRDVVPWPRTGSLVELPEAEAAGLVATGLAVAVDDPRATEIRNYDERVFDMAALAEARRRGEPITEQTAEDAFSAPAA